MLIKEIIYQLSVFEIVKFASAVTGAFNKLQACFNACGCEGVIKALALRRPDKAIIRAMHDQKGRIICAHVIDGVCSPGFIRACLNSATYQQRLGREDRIMVYKIARERERVIRHF